MEPLGQALERVIKRRGIEIPPPKCETCNDLGCFNPRYQPDQEGGAEQVSAQAYCIRCSLGKITAEMHTLAIGRMRQRRVERQLARAGRQLPPGMLSYTLKSYVAAGGEPELARFAATWLDVEPQSFIEDEPPWQPWWYVGGDVGAGKTGLVVPVLLESIRRGGTGGFVLVPDWLQAIRDQYGAGKLGPDEVPPAYVYQDVDLLVLDDLGVERNTDWSTEQLFSLVNYRATHRLRTIITANLSLDELRGRLSQEDKGRRIPSRIQEMCWGSEWVFSVKGKDLRTIQHAKTT